MNAQSARPRGWVEKQSPDVAAFDANSELVWIKAGERRIVCDTIGRLVLLNAVAVDLPWGKL